LRCSLGLMVMLIGIRTSMLEMGEVLTEFSILWKRGW